MHGRHHGNHPECLGVSDQLSGNRDRGNAGFKLMALGDLNGDGIQDLLALTTDYTSHWYPGKGDGTFWSARDIGDAGFSSMALGNIG
jgi:hypothetical protein